FFSLSTFGTHTRIYPGQLAHDGRSDLLFLAHESDSLSRRVYAIPLDSSAAKEFRYFPLTHTVAGVGVDHRARVWVNTGGQLQWLQPATGELTPVPMSGHEATGKVPRGWYM